MCLGKCSLQSYMSFYDNCNKKNCILWLRRCIHMCVVCVRVRRAEHVDEAPIAPNAHAMRAANLCIICCTVGSVIIILPETKLPSLLRDPNSHIRFVPIHPAEPRNNARNVHLHFTARDSEKERKTDARWFGLSAGAVEVTTARAHERN